MSDATIIFDANTEYSYLRRLQQEAIKCLETFPRKVIDLNELINNFMPDSVKNVDRTESTTHPLSKSNSSVSSAVRDYNLTTNPGFDESCYSSSVCDHGRTVRGIYKRKYYRLRGVSGSSMRRRPGPLGQLLTFIASRLAVCTKKIVITPSRFIIDSIVSMFFQKRQLKNVQCGPSSDWSSSLSDYVTTFKKDSTIVGNFIDVMRPATVQLITDTTVLKRWLQALTLAISVPHPVELTSAIRNVETIDCWTYELFFHLKQLQTSRSRQDDNEVTVDDVKFRDEITHTNLWHRLVQLRDNYIILYEILHKNRKVRDFKLHDKETAKFSGL